MNEVIVSEVEVLNEGELDAFPWAYGKKLLQSNYQHADGLAFTKILQLEDGMLEIWLFNQPLLFSEAMFQIAALRIHESAENWRLPSREELLIIRDEVKLETISGSVWCSDVLDFYNRLVHRTLAIDLATMEITDRDHSPRPHQLLAVRAYT